MCTLNPFPRSKGTPAKDKTYLSHLLSQKKFTNNSLFQKQVWINVFLTIQSYKTITKCYYQQIPILKQINKITMFSYTHPIGTTWDISSGANWGTVSLIPSDIVVVYTYFHPYIQLRAHTSAVWTVCRTVS